MAEMRPKHTARPWGVNAFGDVEAGAGFIVASVNGTPDGNVDAGAMNLMEAREFVADHLPPVAPPDNALVASVVFYARTLGITDRPYVTVNMHEVAALLARLEGVAIAEPRPYSGEDTE